MRRPRGFLIWIFLCCWLASGAGAAAWAKSHGKQPQVAKPGEIKEKRRWRRSTRKTRKEVKPEVEAPVVAEPVPPKPPAIEDPANLLNLAREREAAGDLAACLQALVKFVNVYPRHPDRAAVWQRLARLSRDRGQGDQALEIYALTASLYPGTRVEAEARWQAQTLEFYQNLTERDPVASFKAYLKKAKTPPAGLAAVERQEPLRRGWLAVERVLRRSCPCPVPLVEEALALWELHLDGTQPPEAALILGELLQEQGLYGQARSFLQRAWEQGPPEVRTRALVGLLEGAWATRDLADFAAVCALMRRQPGGFTPELKSRLEKLPVPEAFLTAAPVPAEDGKTEEDPLAALVACWSGKSLDAGRQDELLRSLVEFLSRPLPAGVKARLLLHLAHLQWDQGHYPQAAKIYQELLAAGAPGGDSAFYRDRLALSQLKGRRPEMALQIYQGLSQGEDNFWQLVSRTRMADVELRRLQFEPPQ